MKEVIILLMLAALGVAMLADRKPSKKRPETGYEDDDYLYL